MNTQFKSIKISLASPKKIKEWSKLKNKNNNSDEGKIINGKTFNYKTLKPEKGGLFCERIFGSLKDLFSRRHKLGYIELSNPVTHIWYLKGSISYMSIILDMKKKTLEDIAYYLSFVLTHTDSFNYDLDYINFSPILQTNLISHNSIINSSIFKKNNNFALLYNKQNINSNNFIKKITKINNQIINFSTDWINNIKSKTEPEIILKFSNPINLIIHSSIYQNLQLNNLNSLVQNNTTYKYKLFWQLNKQKIKRIIVKQNSYSLDFPILLFNNNKILKQFVLNKKNNFFIINSNLFQINNQRVKYKTNYKLKILNILMNRNHNVKINNKTYFTSINLFTNLSNFQEPPFKILQSGYCFFKDHKDQLIIPQNILQFFIFNNNNTNKLINKLNFKNKNVLFKHYQYNLQFFVWWLYFTNCQNNSNSLNYQNFSILKTKIIEYKYAFLLRHIKKIKTNKRNKPIKYISNILTTFYNTYSEFNKLNFMNTNKIFTFRVSKVEDGLFKNNFNNILTNSNNKDLLTNLNLIEKRFTKTKVYNKSFSNTNKSTNLKCNTNIKVSFFNTTSDKTKNILKKLNKKNNKNKNNYKTKNAKLTKFSKLETLIKNYGNKIIINEYCFSIIRFQTLLKSLYSNYEFHFSNKFSNIYLNRKHNFGKDITKLNELKIIKSYSLLLTFEKNVSDQKIDLPIVKFKNKLKTQLINQLYLNSKFRNKNYNFNYIPRFLKINKQKYNYNKSIRKFDYKTYDCIKFTKLKNPLGNSKFRKFITFILFTTIQKSLMISKIKFFKTLLMSKLVFKKQTNNKFFNYDLKNYELEIYTKKKQLIIFFFTNYGSLREFFINSTNEVKDILNNTNLYNFSFKKQAIINYKINNSLWLTKLNNEFNNNLIVSSFISLDKNDLINNIKMNTKYSFIYLNFLKTDFTYLVKNYKNYNYFSNVFLNLKTKTKINKLIHLNKNITTIEFPIYKNKLFKKVISSISNFNNLKINNKSNTQTSFVDLGIILLKTHNIFSTMYIYGKNLIWNFKKSESLIFGTSLMNSNYWHSTVWYNFKKKVTLPSSNFTHILTQFLSKNQLHFNKYYIIDQFSTWDEESKDNFLRYITKLACSDDRIIPDYIDRSISFNQPSTGASAIKNMLKNFNITLGNFSINTNKVNYKLLFSDYYTLSTKKYILRSKIKQLSKYFFLSLYTDDNNSSQLISTDLLMLNIKTSIKLINKEIREEKSQLKYASLFAGQKYSEIVNQSKFESTFYRERGFNYGNIKEVFLEDKGIVHNEALKNSQVIISEKKMSYAQVTAQAILDLNKLNRKKLNNIRRLKLIKPFLINNTNVEWMVLDILPVLPPTLRPILFLSENQMIVSDLNKLYQKVIFRNERIKRLIIEFYSLESSSELIYSQRLLQESVDALLENGKGGSNISIDNNNKPLKSLSDMLTGKKGRFRQNLLGKRVDYSGRSVIVVGPTLMLHECGLPEEMAIQLFQFFLMRLLINYKICRNYSDAKYMIKCNSNSKLISMLLNFLLKNRPILLNRAPTLHRLGIQAFQPKLVLGRAILLHPLVCSAFNADFDGDQMAVHVPLFQHACAEAWRILGSRNNILSAATGEPNLVPSQDMVLGCYYLTTLDTIQRIETINYFNSHLLFSLNYNNIEDYSFTTVTNNIFLIFSNKQEVFQLLNQQLLGVHTLVWLKLKSKIDFDLNYQNCLETQIDNYGNIIKIYLEYIIFYNWRFNKILVYIKTTPGRIVVNKTIFETLLN